MTPTDHSCDVLIIGGGLAGLSLAVALSREGIRTAVVDRTPPDTQRTAAFDGRASALAQGSQRIFHRLGLWPAMAGAAAPILHIEITDGCIDQARSPFALSFDHRAVGTEPMGWIVENRVMRRVLHDQITDCDDPCLFAPHNLAGLTRRDTAVVAQLDSGQKITARLVIGADGRQSPVRVHAGIRTTGRDYHQNGLVTTVYHDRPHGGVAHEHFLPAGPFALLPLCDGDSGAHRSSLVWSEKRALAPHYMAMDDNRFADELHRRFGGKLGDFSVGGDQWSYPLSSLHAERMTDHRLALIGDAAHGMHPIAGQGLNLGLRDIAALTDVLVAAKTSGQDLGSAPVLARYARWRRFDSVVMLCAMDGLVTLFSNDIPPLRLARGVGLAAVNNIAPLRKFFIKHAMGTVGDLPSLMREHLY